MLQRENFRDLLALLPISQVLPNHNPRLTSLETKIADPLSIPNGACEAYLNGSLEGHVVDVVNVVERDVASPAEVDVVRRGPLVDRVLGGEQG